jgi:hypothetical protein
MQKHAHDLGEGVIVSAGDRAQATVHIETDMKLLHVRRFEMRFLDVGEENTESRSVSLLSFVLLVGTACVVYSLEIRRDQALHDLHVKKEGQDF